MQVRVQTIRYIDLHHTAGHETNTQRIREIHMSPPNNWGDIGYNSVIEPSGVVGAGRDVKWAGAHDPGTILGETYNMNQVAYAISHIGNFMVDEMSEIQFQASVAECARVCKLYDIPPTKERVRRHKDQYATNCPGDKFPYDRYVAELKKRLEGGNNVLEHAVVYFTDTDFSSARIVSRKLGGCAMYCRDGVNANIHKDVENCEHPVIVGGAELDIPGVTNCCGLHAEDTAIKAAQYAKTL